MMTNNPLFLRILVTSCIQTSPISVNRHDPHSIMHIVMCLRILIINIDISKNAKRKKEKEGRKERKKGRKRRERWETERKRE